VLVFVQFEPDPSPKAPAGMVQALGRTSTGSSQACSMQGGLCRIVPREPGRGGPGPSGRGYRACAGCCGRSRPHGRRYARTSPARGSACLPIDPDFRRCRLCSSAASGPADMPGQKRFRGDAAFTTPRPHEAYARVASDRHVVGDGGYRSGWFRRLRNSRGLGFSNPAIERLRRDSWALYDSERGDTWKEVAT
jgi:hypothetical protein